MSYIYQTIITPDEEGFNVEVPDLPGCFTFGRTLEEALAMAADAMKTYVASLLLDGEKPPAFVQHECPAGSKSIDIYFDTDDNYIVTGEVVSASQAARDLGVSRGRITQMMDAGILQGFRRGRGTYITVESIKARKNAAPKAGRPKISA